MRTALTILFIAFFASTYAGDSLTRAQVYNYSIGDTFDYHYYNYSHGYVAGPDDTTIICNSYTRYVISDIFISPDSLTKYICRTKVYPPPVILDTITLTELSDIEVINDLTQDTALYGASYTINGLPDYFMQTINSVTYNGGLSPIAAVGDPFGSGQTYFANQMGPVIMSYYAYVPPQREYIDSFNLIYYSGHAGTYGTPYYYYPDAISDLSPTVHPLKVYPTLNAGVFNVDIADPSHMPWTFTLYTYTGDKVKDLVLYDAQQTISIDEISSGLYIWMATSGSDHQAGKIAIQK